MELRRRRSQRREDLCTELHLEVGLSLEQRRQLEEEVLSQADLEEGHLKLEELVALPLDRPLLLEAWEAHLQVVAKIKRAEKPVKTFEEKTSEEKIKTMQQLSKEIGATGAKSIMKTTKGKKSGKVAFGQCLVYEYDKDPISNEVAKRVDSKDISDMRDEKTKMRDLLQEQENKQLAEFKRVQEMMNKKTG
jgi:hypothetical protein